MGDNKSDNRGGNGVVRGLVLLILVLGILSVAAIVWMFPGRGLGNQDKGLVADIYQDGELILSIPLDEVEESYRFVVDGMNGGRNEIEVRPGEIGMAWANCPDGLCIRMGFRHNSLLPITCLPHKLVIQIRTGDRDGDLPDAIVY